MKKLIVTLAVLPFLIGAGCNNNRTPTSSIPAQPNFTNTISAITTTVKQEPPKETKLSIVINKNLPKYTINLTNSSAAAAAHINIFRGSELKIPLQVITLDPNIFVRMTDNLPFASEDVNFDGYIDIGVLVDGGVKWGAFQYWIFDKNTGLFTSTTYTQELKGIGYNKIKFDTKNKRIITSNFFGAVAGGAVSIFQYDNGHLKLIEDNLADNIAVEPTKQDSVINCQITIKKYDGNKDSVMTKTLPHECPSDYFGF